MAARKPKSKPVKRAPRKASKAAGAAEAKRATIDEALGAVGDPTDAEALADMTMQMARAAVDAARGRGRPTDFKPEYVDQARKLVELGATDDDVAEFFDVSVRTIYRWSATHADFCQALKLGKVQADTRVERSLYHRAVGYTRDAVKIFLPKDGSPVVVPYREHVPPDTTAAIFWLKNRQRENWRDRHELTGAGGAPLVPEHSDDPEAANARRASAMLALLARLQAEGAPKTEPDPAAPAEAAPAKAPAKGRRKT